MNEVTSIETVMEGLRSCGVEGRVMCKEDNDEKFGAKGQ